jgi:cation transport ATPase
MQVANQGDTQEEVDVKAEIKKLQQKVGRLTVVCTVLIIVLLIFLWIPDYHRNYYMLVTRALVIRVLACAALVIALALTVCGREGPCHN